MQRTGATCSSRCRSNAPPPWRRSELPSRFSPPSTPATPAALSPSSTPACRRARNLFDLTAWIVFTKCGKAPGATVQVVLEATVVASQVAESLVHDLGQPDLHARPGSLI